MTFLDGSATLSKVTEAYIDRQVRPSGINICQYVQIRWGPHSVNGHIIWCSDVLQVRRGVKRSVL